MISIAMVKAEDIMMAMPHPRTKNNTGYPDGYKDKAFFKDAALRELSAIAGAWASTARSAGSARLRCLPLLDETSNWFANDPTPPKLHHGDLGSAGAGAGRRHLLERARQLPEARYAADAGRHELDHQDDASAATTSSRPARC